MALSFLTAPAAHGQRVEARIEGTGFNGSIDPTGFYANAGAPYGCGQFGICGQYVDANFLYAARASIGSGALGVQISAVNSLPLVGRQTVRASFQDAFTFAQSGQVTFRTRVDGSADLRLGSDGAFAEIILGYELSGGGSQTVGQFGATYNQNGLGGQQIQYRCTTRLACTNEFSVSDGFLTDYHVDLVTNVVAGTSYLLNTQLSGRLSDGLNLMFNNTAQVEIITAPENSWTSRSGLFLVDRAPVPVTPVPEPGTWALLAAGLGMLGVRARRRRA
jgi:hypothetical protein